MRELIQDVRHALRALRRAPVVTGITVAVLAVAIGATATLWQALDAAVLRPLPYPESERLARVFDLHDGAPWTVSPSNFVDYRDQAKSFSSMAAFSEDSFALSGVEGAAEQVSGAYVTAEFFRTLRLEAMRGRTLGPADDERKVAVLSDELWRRRYGSDPGIVGRTIRVDGEAREVVGVLPPDRDYPFGSRLWVPLAFSEETLRTQRGAHWLGVIARLAPGATLATGDAEVRGIGERLAKEYPRTNDKGAALARSLRDWTVRDSRATLGLIFGAVVLALLAACANLASLSLARTVSRGRELALKSSLGAGSRRLARGLLVENLLLALAGAGAGSALAGAAVRQLPTLLDLPRLEGLQLDRAGVLALAALAGVAGLLVGIAPASFALRRDPAEVMRATGTTIAGARGAGRVRRLLVVATTALALMLVAGSLLVVRSYRRVAAVSPGFEAAGRLLFSVSLPSSDYATPEANAAFAAELERRLEALPGVEGVGAEFGQPFTGFSYSISLRQLDGRLLEGPSGAQSAYEQRRSPQIRFVTPGYFDAMGIPLRGGRRFTADDRYGAPNVVVASESGARLVFEGENPIGHTLEIGTTNRLGRGHIGGEVVGVVGDVREQQLDDEPWPILYFVQDQFPVGFLTFVVRAAPERLPGLVASIRAAVTELDADLPIFRVRTMEELVRESLATRRSVTRLLAGFALVATILAALGLFGVLTQTVTEQRRELAVRSALGATPHALAMQVLRSAGLLAGVGIVAGLAAVLPLSRYLASVLYQLSPTDPPSLAAAAVVLFAVALTAGWLPARRVLQLDPIAALRED